MKQHPIECKDADEVGDYFWYIECKSADGKCVYYRSSVSLNVAMQYWAINPLKEEVICTGSWGV